MKTIDNTIKYYELLMNYDDTSRYINYNLPEGYHFEFYKQGDEKEWINIHISSGEFTSFERGLQYFHDFYDSFLTELNNRCFFIVADNTNLWLKQVASRPRYKYLLTLDDPMSEYRNWWQMIPNLAGSNDSYKSWPSGNMTIASMLFTDVPREGS